MIKFVESMFPDHTLYEASTGGHFLNTLLKRWSTWSSLSEKPFSDNNNDNKIIIIIIIRIRIIIIIIITIIIIMIIRIIATQCAPAPFCWSGEPPPKSLKRGRLDKT